MHQKQWRLFSKTLKQTYCKSLYNRIYKIIFSISVRASTSLEVRAFTSVFLYKVINKNIYIFYIHPSKINILQEIQNI